MRAGRIWADHTLVDRGIEILIRQVEGAVVPLQIRIFISDVRAFYDQQGFSGQPFASALTHWHNDYTSFEVKDPDGHIITFAS